MAVAEVLEPSVRESPYLRFGRPLLTVAQARSWKRFGAAAAVLTLLAGCLMSVHAWHHIYDVTYGWLALGTFVAVSTAAQVLSVVPTVRLSGECE